MQSHLNSLQDVLPPNHIRQPPCIEYYDVYSYIHQSDRTQKQRGATCLHTKCTYVYTTSSAFQECIYIRQDSQSVNGIVYHSLLMRLSP